MSAASGSEYQPGAAVVSSAGGGKSIMKRVSQSGATRNDRWHDTSVFGRRRDIRRLDAVFRTMLKSKIHRATVTHADLHYVGSVTVDRDLMDAADLLPGEQVSIVDVTNGARLETYVIEGERGSGVLGINGAAAHLVHEGDLVILISYAQFDDAAARAFEPRIVHVDAANVIVELGNDAGEPGASGAQRSPHAVV